MNSFRTLISGRPGFVFIIDAENWEICEVSENVIAVCGSPDLIGKKFQSIVHAEEDMGTSAPVYFNSQWLTSKQEHFTWDKKPLLKITLFPHPSVPDKDTMVTIRNLIAVLVHRLRSPLTGAQGYLDMITEIDKKSDVRKLDKIGEGLDQVFEMMDELELFHNIEDIPAESKPLKEEVDPQIIIQEILLLFPAEIRNRVIVKSPRQQRNFNFSPAILKSILTQLIQNAAEHISGKDYDILIDIHSSRRITITNGGDPIPSNIAANLFFPFVTSKANKMGIGLSQAQSLANSRQAIILLSENSESGISFTLLLPPKPD